MGYYTYYNLNISYPKGTDLSSLAGDIEEMCSDLEICMGANLEEHSETELPEGTYWQSNDSLKWYDHDDDMLRLSVLHPDILFDLFGDGEEEDDFWHTYYKNGAMQFDGVELVYHGYEAQLMEQKIPPAAIVEPEEELADDIDDITSEELAAVYGELLT